MSAEELYELAEAAEILGVHPSTLRRWADAGKVACIHTLSGRRRFTHAALEQARQDMLQPMGSAQPQRLESKTLEMARLRSTGLVHEQSAWFAQLNDEQRLMFRYGGQRLLGLMTQFISRDDTDEAFLAEGRRIAGDYGLICFRAGLSISQMAEAFLYYRRSMIESVLASTGLSGPHDLEGNRIFLRTVEFFDALLVATIDSYTKVEQSGKVGV